ncbi:MAG TPA: class I SAM-dependent methyltransferase [Gammaproteobacteria bacterium]
MHSVDVDVRELKPVELSAPGAKVIVTPLPSGRNRIDVHKLDESLVVKFAGWETAYDLELIRLILKVKGPSYLCDEIARDESAAYTGAALRWALLGYVGEETFAHKRILDFGCGSGASTARLCRMFPSASVIGVDIHEDSLEIARARARFYGLRNAKFVLSAAGDEVPSGLGRFDHVVLCAVYEHLLPEERESLLPKLWAALEPGGVLFLRETPHRFFPIETHTTGLPLINYLPPRAALWLTRKCSRYWSGDVTWPELLRGGVRGATIGEIERILKRCPGRARLLKPRRLGVEDRIDLWYLTAEKSRHSASKHRIYRILKGMKRFTGVEFPPYLELALQKQPASA